MKEDYLITIGLEVHAELKTKSKMWCGCTNDPFASKPNTYICPICMAEPGTLPVPNKAAIEKVIKVGLAFNSKIADFTEFDRKNYFYPDIPKGYQISQYKYPIVTGGSLGDVAITRVHLEEDTAKSVHDQGTFTLIDFNRAGVPLMELVTEACIHSATQAGQFARELQLILRTLDVSDANMEMGQMRVEVNFSVSKDPKVLGTKVEVKNLNSFKSVEKAIEYEYQRHTELLESGRGTEIVQETRGWDETKQVTFSQRKKENAHDYRYFPDPDIPKLYLSKLCDIEKMRLELPELPSAKRSRFVAMGIKTDICDILVTEMRLANYLDEILATTKNTELAVDVANFLTSDVLGLLRRDLNSKLPSSNNFAKLITMYRDGQLSSRAVKDLLPAMLLVDSDPENLAQERGLIQKNDSQTLTAIVETVIAAHNEQWQKLLAGNDKLIMFFVGQAMKESNGSGNPAKFQEIISELSKK